MQSFLPTIILRHRRENLKKCSLRGLESRTDFTFFTYPKSSVPDLSGYIILAIDAPPLTRADAGYGLFILDGTWRYAEKMLRSVETSAKLEQRSIPKEVKTAYPRRQDDCPEPESGLASIEAIYVAYRILGRDTTGLLENYYWKKEFLDKNAHFFERLDR